MNYSVPFQKKENYFGLACNEGVKMPLKAGMEYTLDLRKFHSGNQAAAVLVSDCGSYIYSENPFSVTVKGDALLLEGEDIHICQNGSTLRDAYLGLVKAFFHSDHKTPDMKMFLYPQFNTWIEMGYDCTQEKVLHYVDEMLEHHYPSGVLMIDDRWCVDYGVWEFDSKKFPNPKEMVKKIHDLGFTLMLWVCPFLSPDSEEFRKVENTNIIVKNKDGSAAITHWWNGYSAVVDLTTEEGKAYFKSKLDYLQNEYGIDGFKLDAADPEFYLDSFDLHGMNRSMQTKEYAAIGEDYAFNELRVAFNNSLRGVTHRLRDKNHSWDYDGINTLIPDGILEGLLGYPYFCPDMIGGGMILDFQRKEFRFSEELYVRYAQASALLPMMQFSLSPWKVLSEENQKIVLDAVKLHEIYAPLIQKLAKKASQTGEPIIRSLSYVTGESKYSEIMDEFFLGDSVLVAPMVRPGTKRKVILPKGKWIDDNGVNYKEGEYEIDVPLSRIPFFRKSK